MMTGQRRRTRLAILATLLAVLTVGALAAACGSSGEAASPSPLASSSTTGEVLTREDLLAFVEKAVVYAGEVGKEEALAAFNAPSGEFNHGELYIFAYDFNGKNLAHGYDQSLVGKDLIDLTDPTGKPIIKEFVRIAKGGERLAQLRVGEPGEQRPRGAQARLHHEGRRRLAPGCRHLRAGGAADAGRFSVAVSVNGAAPLIGSPRRPVTLWQTGFRCAKVTRNDEPQDTEAGRSSA